MGVNPTGGLPRASALRPPAPTGGVTSTAALSGVGVSALALLPLVPRPSGAAGGAGAASPLPRRARVASGRSAGASFAGAGGPSSVHRLPPRPTWGLGSASGAGGGASASDHRRPARPTRGSGSASGGRVSSGAWLTDFRALCPPFCKPFGGDPIAAERNQQAAAASTWTTGVGRKKD